MELTAKVRGGKYILFDEEGKRVAEVQNVRLKGSQMKVQDEKGETLYTVVKDGDTIEVSGLSGGKLETGRMMYEQDEAGNIVQPNLFRPPMAEKLCLSSPWGEIQVVQNSKREFGIFLDQKKAGKMTHMLGLHKKITEASEGLPMEVYGLIFGLGMYMLREDDVEIV